MTIPGFPDNVVALAYRPAAEGEHWFEPPLSEEGTGLLHPGPSKDVVLVVAAAEGYVLQYDIDSDTTVVAKQEPIPADAAAADATGTPEPLRAHDLMSFSEMCKRLLNGTAARAARASWHASRYIRPDAAHAPHFANEANRPWAFRSDDLRARDWRVVA